MKKRFSVLTVGIIGFLMLATSVYAMVNWEGTENVDSIKANLVLIQNKIDTLKEDSGSKDQTIREIEILLEQQENIVKQKDTELINKQQEIENKQKEVQDKQKEVQDKIDEINQKIAENNKLIEENNQLKEKADKVDGLEDEVENLKNEKAVLTTDNNSLRNQLDKALKDVKEIEAITNKMIE